MADTNSIIWGRRAKVTVDLARGSFVDAAPTDSLYGPLTANAMIVEGGDGDPEGPRITFKVMKTIEKTPNTSDVTLWNLADNTRTTLTQFGKGAQIVLETGYQSSGLITLFFGDVRTIDHVRDESDWRTIFKCGDGERAIRYARASESFAGGTQVGSVVNYLVGQMGLKLGNSANQASKLSTKLQQGWTVHGGASTELDRILRSVKYRYSVQDGEVQILLPGASVAQTIPLLSPDSGLIGSPEMGTPEKKGKPAALKFKSLLLPESRPGGRVQLQSTRYDGIYLTRRVDHSGDTIEQEWYSNFESTQDSTVQAA